MNKLTEMLKNALVDLSLRLTPLSTAPIQLRSDYQTHVTGFLDPNYGRPEMPQKKNWDVEYRIYLMDLEEQPRREEYSSHRRGCYYCGLEHYGSQCPFMPRPSAAAA